jgi:hypothetical protein
MQKLLRAFLLWFFCTIDQPILSVSLTNYYGRRICAYCKLAHHSAKGEKNEEI